MPRSDSLLIDVARKLLREVADPRVRRRAADHRATAWRALEAHGLPSTGRLSGRLLDVAFARDVDRLAVIGPGFVALVDRAACTIEPHDNLAGEPRDTVILDGATPAAIGDPPPGLVDHLLDEGRTDVFLLFLESVKNLANFERVAAKARAAGKPIAGDHASYQAMFRRHGIIEAADLEDMVDLAAAFSLHQDRLPAGNRIGIGTASGGGGGWIADACVAAGLEVPLLDAPTRALLDPRIPDYGSSKNPVDATAQAIVQAGYGELARLIAASETIDAVIMIVSARSAASFEREIDALTRLAHDSPKPIVMWSYTLPTAETTRLLSQAGYALFTSMQSCARTVAAMAAYRARR